MTAATALTWLSRGQPLAASIPSNDPTRLAWVGVYPLDLTRETTRELIRNHAQELPAPEVRVYRIRCFEVDRALIEQDTSIGESNLERKLSFFAYGEDELAKRLELLGIGLPQLAPIYQTDYPI